MSITVANLLAQIGADLSQFRLGMNEVGSRIKLAESRYTQANAHIAELQGRAQMAAVASARYADMAAAIPIQRYLTQLDKSKEELSLLEKKIVTANKQSQLAINRIRTEVRKNQEGMWTQAQYAEVATLEETNKKIVLAYEERKHLIEAENAKILKSIEAGIIQQQILTDKSIIQRNISAGLGQRVGQYRNVADDMLAFNQARAAKLAQSSSEYATHAYSAIFGKMVIAGAATEAVLGVAAAKGIQFNQMLVEQANNTSLSAAGIVKMKEAIQRLGVETGISFEELAKGFRNIENYGNDAGQSTKIMEAAVKASVITGAQFADTANVVAGTMKNYKLSVDQAGYATNVFYEISKLSRGEMGDHVKTLGRLIGISRVWGDSVQSVGAAYATLIQHQIPATRATTGLISLYKQFSTPTKQAETAIRNIDKALGDTSHTMERMFTPAGTTALGFEGFFRKLAEIADKLKSKGLATSFQDFANKITTAQRGGTEGTILVKNLSDYLDHVNKLKKAIPDLADVQNRYNKRLEDSDVKLRGMSNSLIVTSSTIADALKPQIASLTSTIVNLNNWWKNLSEGTRTATVEGALFAGGAFVIIGIVGKVVTGLVQLRNGLMNVQLVIMVSQWRNALASFATAAVANFGSIGNAALVMVGKLGLIYVVLSTIYEIYKGIKGEMDRMDSLKGDPKFEAGKWRDIAKRQQDKFNYEKGGMSEIDRRNHQQALDYSNAQVYKWEHTKAIVSGVNDVYGKNLQHLKDINSEISNGVSNQKRLNDLTIDKAKIIVAIQKSGGTIPAGLGFNDVGSMMTGGDGIVPPLNPFIQHLGDTEKAAKKQKTIHDIMLKQAQTFMHKLDEVYAAQKGESSLQGQFDILYEKNKRFRTDFSGHAQARIDEIEQGKKTLELQKDSVAVMTRYKDLSENEVGNADKWREILKDINDLHTRGFHTASMAHVEEKLHTAEVIQQLAAYDKIAERVQKIKDEAGKYTESPKSAYQQFLDKIKSDPEAYAQLGETAAKKLATQVQTGENLKDWMNSANYSVEGLAGSFDKLGDRIKNDIEKVKEFRDYNIEIERVHQRIADRASERTRPDLVYADRYLAEVKQSAYYKTLKDTAAEDEKIKRIGLADYYNLEMEKINALTQGYYELGAGVKFTIEQWKKMSQELKDQFKKAAMNAEILDEMRQFATGIADVFVQSLDNIRQHGFRGFFQNILADFDNMLFQMAAKWLQSQIVRLLMNVITNAFSVGGGGNNITDMSQIVGRAAGGPISAGRAYIVGEQGPELFIPSKNGRIATVGNSIGSGEIHIHHHWNIMTPNAQSFQASKSQMMADAAAVTSRAARRNG